MLEKRDLEKALQEGGIKAYFQPQLGLKPYKIVGAEALARYEDEGSIIPAYQLFEVAKTYNLETVIDFQIVKQVVGIINQRKNRNIPISVNLSSEMVHDENKFNRYLEYVSKECLFPHEIHIELSETITISGEIVKKLKRINLHNIAIAIDDFGHNFSHLEKLDTFAEYITILKIDQYFIQKETSEGVFVLKLARELAKAFNFFLIAEGVEKETQLTFLRLLNCDAIQGFIFSRPLNPKTYFQLIEMAASMCFVNFVPATQILNPFLDDR